MQVQPELAVADVVRDDALAGRLVAQSLFAAAAVCAHCGCGPLAGRALFSDEGALSFSLAVFALCSPG